MSLPARAERVRNVIQRPADLWLFARMLAWAAALPVAKRRLSLVHLVEAAAPTRNPRTARSAESAIALARWVYRVPLFRDNCLEKSLLTFHYLPSDGRQYRLVLGFRGVGRDAPPGHAWLTVDGVPVHDTREALADLTPVVAFDEAGRQDLGSLERVLPPRPSGGDEGGPEAN